MNALEINGLTKKFSGFTLDNISFALPEGCILGLVGENGAGKSTTIKLILDMLHKDSGSVRVFGRDNTEDIKSVKEDVGTVMDEAGIPECLNARQVGRIMRATFPQLERLFIPRASEKAFRSRQQGVQGAFARHENEARHRDSSFSREQAAPARRADKRARPRCPRRGAGYAQRVYARGKSFDTYILAYRERS